jgi:hypothetical protein
MPGNSTECRRHLRRTGHSGSPATTIQGPRCGPCRASRSGCAGASGWAKGVIFARKEPVTRDVLARGVGPQYNLNLGHRGHPR